MTYDECLSYLFSQLPMYQRIGKAAYKADLQSTIDLCEYLGNPQRNFISIHVAGTNGKGSVSHMLASILQESGYKTGLYTSPHLKDFRERIRINGEMIPQNEVLEFVEKHLMKVSDLKPSFFEWTVGLAFQYFSDQKIDVAVLETGMGGRLDSTNIVTPAISIITNIGFDHMQFLGNSLDAIATEKAGIIKKGVPVVIGETVSETRNIFIQKATSEAAEIFFAEEREFDMMESDLIGPYQFNNQRTVITAVEILRNNGWHLSDDTIRKGLLKAKQNTGLRGRWEWISKEPPILIDMAHNVAGVSVAIRALLKLKFNQLHVVWGMVSDKDITEIIALLPKKATYYFCKPNIPRGLDENILKIEAEKSDLEGNVFSSVQLALESAKVNCAKDDLIFIGGSTFVVAEVV